MIQHLAPKVLWFLPEFQSVLMIPHAKQMHYNIYDDLFEKGSRATTRMRYYDPGLSVWMSVDTLAENIETGLQVVKHGSKTSPNTEVKLRQIQK